MCELQLRNAIGTEHCKQQLANTWWKIWNSHTVIDKQSIKIISGYNKCQGFPCKNKRTNPFLERHRHPRKRKRNTETHAFNIPCTKAIKLLGKHKQQPQQEPTTDSICPQQTKQANQIQHQHPQRNAARQGKSAGAKASIRGTWTPN